MIVLNFHAQDLTNGCGRDLHGTGPDSRPGAGQQKRDDFYPQAGPGRQMKRDFF